MSTKLIFYYSIHSNQNQSREREDAPLLDSKKSNFMSQHGVPSSSSFGPPRKTEEGGRERAQGLKSPLFKAHIGSVRHIYAQQIPPFRLFIIDDMLKKPLEKVSDGAPQSTRSRFPGYFPFLLPPPFIASLVMQYGIRQLSRTIENPSVSCHSLRLLAFRWLENFGESRAIRMPTLCYSPEIILGHEESLTCENRVIALLPA